MSKGDPIQLEAAEHISKKWLTQYREHCEPEARIHICGSIRRKEKMVRDIDILVIDAAMSGAFQRGAKFDGVELNLCFIAPVSEGAGLLFLTGSSHFNISLRAIAKRKGMKLNRYGLWRGDALIASKTETDIFKALGIDYVAPEGRRSPTGMGLEGIKIIGSQQTAYEVFINSVHGFNFCSCKGFQYRRNCRHLGDAQEQV